MPERGLDEKLNQAIDAMLSQGELARAAGMQRELASLLRVSAELRGLPRESFKATLKADLIRRPTMASVAGAKEKVEAQEQTVTPCLCFRDAARAIEFYKEVFGAEESFRLNDRQKLGVAEIRIGNTRFILSREAPEYGTAGGISPETLGGSTVRLKIMVADADATASRMLAAGGRIVRPVADEFYGERVGQIADPFGYTWIVATHKEDVSTEEMQRRLDELTKQSSESAEGKLESTTGASGTGAVKQVSYIREGFRTVSPYILVNGAAKFIVFLTEAFGATERGRVPVPGGKIMHAEVQLGDSMIELSDGNEQYEPTPVAIHHYVDDVDATYARALAAGAISTHAPVDQPYGDREAGVKDPFGNNWFIAKAIGWKPQRWQAHSVQPYLFLHDAEKMVPFLEAAFGAKADGVHKSSEGVVVHAAVHMGDTTIEFSEAHGPWQPSVCHLHLYVPDTDAMYAQALRAGAASIEAPNDKPYGDRSAGVRDAWGNSWFIVTHIKDVAF